MWSRADSNYQREGLQPSALPLELLDHLYVNYIKYIKELCVWSG